MDGKRIQINIPHGYGIDRHIYEMDELGEIVREIQIDNNELIKKNDEKEGTTTAPLLKILSVR